MKFPLLLDIYGTLLSDRRREIVDYYYNEDYSLAEISEITGISRQGVRDSIKKSEDEIYSLEEKLGIARKNRLALEKIDSIEKVLSSDNETVEKNNEIRAKIMRELDELRSLIRAED